MADFDNRLARTTTATAGYDAGLRAYMLRVYNYMVLGLLVTGLASAGLYMLSVTTDSSAAAAANPTHAASASTTKSIHRACRPGAHSCRISIAPVIATAINAVDSRFRL